MCMALARLCSLRGAWVSSTVHVFAGRPSKPTQRARPSRSPSPGARTRHCSLAPPPIATRTISARPSSICTALRPCQRCKKKSPNLSSGLNRHHHWGTDRPRLRHGPRRLNTKFRTRLSGAPLQQENRFQPSPETFSAVFARERLRRSPVQRLAHRLRRLLGIRSPTMYSRSLAGFDAERRARFT